MNIQVHQATIEDLHLLVELFDQYRIFYKQASDKKAAEKFLFDRFEHNQSVIFIAKDIDTGTGAGFTQLYPIFSSVSMQRVWLLNDLFVADSFRKIGVAASLMNAAKDFALITKAKSLQLSTAVDNFAAQSLYEQLGYKKEEGFLNYFLRLPKAK